jgi:hypothetical protein
MTVVSQRCEDGLTRFRNIDDYLNIQAKPRLWKLHYVTTHPPLTMKQHKVGMCGNPGFCCIVCGSTIPRYGPEIIEERDAWFRAYQERSERKAKPEDPLSSVDVNKRGRIHQTVHSAVSSHPRRAWHCSYLPLKNRPRTTTVLVSWACH